MDSQWSPGSKPSSFAVTSHSAYHPALSHKMPQYNMDPEEQGNEEKGEWSPYETKCHSVSFGCRNRWFRIELNPVVTILSALIIWGLVIWCMVEPEEARSELTPWMMWITKHWTWLYIGTQDVWAIVIIVIFFSKYGNMRLGKQDEKPEYSDLSYFSMLFAAGIGIGLFYFGVAEPIFHYQPGPYGNRYWNRYTDNQRAQDAINITLFHWGIHGWIVYVLVGLLLAFVSYRWNLPMTVRSCFYPLIGDRIYGFVGDFIDILSVVCTLFGVCTSLGLGVMQLNAGLHRMNRDIEENTTNQVIIIWCITALATISVISGIKLGIRRLSEICFGLGVFIMMVVFLYDEPWYILNVYVQSIGYYLQTIVQLGFHADAFAQQGDAPDGKEAPTWMNDWTIFYWGWWIAWSPFVGMFIAKISRGRTIKDFITYTLTVPCLYGFFWFSIFGAVGIKMDNLAVAANLTCDSPKGGTDATESFNGLYLLSCRSSTDMWFDVMEFYDGLGGFLSVISLAGIILYFVTSSDSGSLVIDCLSANGHPDPPIIQRIFWALTEGATATALLVSGGSDALSALRTVSIAAGLPYTIVLNFMCVALWRALKIEAGDLAPDGPAFAIDLIGIFSIDLNDFFPSLKRLRHFFIAIFVPWLYIGKAHGRHNKCSPIPTMIILAVMFYGWIVLCALEPLHNGLFYVGWTVYFFYATYGAILRMQIRTDYEINGNMVEDWFAMFLLYPATAVQLDIHTEAVDYNEYNKKNDIGLQMAHPANSSSTTNILNSSGVNENGLANGGYAGDGSQKVISQL